MAIRRILRNYHYDRAIIEKGFEMSASCEKCMNIRMSRCGKTLQYFYRCSLDDKNMKKSDVCNHFIGSDDMIKLKRVLK